jgi:hypothetical protein
MRPQGHASISPTHPRARAVCDRCYFTYNHDQLQWQYDWQGPKIQNKRILVCMSCLDKMQENGQRTILIPADPIPITNARPEIKVSDNNPLSTIGANASPLLWQYGSQIGNMIQNGGIAAAFDSNTNKPAAFSATIATANSSFNNYVGINWTGSVTGLPPGLLPTTIQHAVGSYNIYGPNDTTIGSTGYVIQGSQVNAGWGSWTTIASGNSAGTVGEVISGTTTPLLGGGNYQFHRAAFWGGAGSIMAAQVQFYTTN